MNLQLQDSIVSGWQVIRVEGSVDSKTVGELRDFLDAKVTGSAPVALDLAEVSFLSSAGLRTLLTLHRQTQQLGVSLILVGMRTEIIDIMTVTGFYQYFKVLNLLSELPSAP